MDIDFQVRCRGKLYENIDDAINDYINEINPGISQIKLDRILKAIHLDVFENVLTGVTYLKSPVAPLSPVTIRKKGHSKPFLDTGILLSQFKDEILSETHGIVFIGNENERDEIAYYLQEGTHKMPARPFFDFSEKVLSDIDKILLEDL
ncbi:MAG: hypothetical protein HOP31_08835 [Ignavibacteria bacterium]|nr:hypothetical protein [Ignavibacteria bacterium]